MDIELVEFLSLSITEEAKAICEYNKRAEESKNLDATKLFKEIANDETQHLRELTKLLSTVVDVTK